jgi:hypothetical protein
MRRALFAVSFVPVLALSCSTCQPPPDPDGVTTGAQPLELGSWHRDALDCEEGDCADWYRFETSEPGTLRVDAVRLEDDRELPEFSVALADGDGVVLEEAKSGGQTRARLTHPKAKGQHVPAGRFALAVSTPAEDEGALGYELRVTFKARPKPKPPPPPPRAEPSFRTMKAVVLEVEARADGGEAVLIDQGSRSGVARGQIGRLLVGGKKVADIEIVDVYPEGSRARIRGALGAAITPNTVAEIDVPQ